MGCRHAGDGDAGLREGEEEGGGRREGGRRGGDDLDGGGRGGGGGGEGRGLQPPSPDTARAALHELRARPRCGRARRAPRRASRAHMAGPNAGSTGGSP